MDLHSSLACNSNQHQKKLNKVSLELCYFAPVLLPDDEDRVNTCRCNWFRKVQPGSILTSTSSTSWTFLGDRVARARSFFTGDFLATTAVFRARPDLVCLTERNNEIFIMLRSRARRRLVEMAVSWAGRPRRAAHVLGDVRFLGNDLTIDQR